MLVDNYLVAVISLPAGVFNPYSGVKTSILILDKQLAKQTDSILFVKIASDGFGLGAQRRATVVNDLPQAVENIQGWMDGKRNGTACDISEGMNTTDVPKIKIAASSEYNLSGDRYGLSLSQTPEVEWAEISNISNVFCDGDWIESKDQSSLGIRLIQTGNVGVGEYLDKPRNARYITEETFKRLNCTEVFPGDVLVSRLPDPVGRACIVPETNERLITSVDCTIIRFDLAKMIPALFVAYCKHNNYYKHIEQFLTGASRSRISRSNLGHVSVPLPPLSVQEEIVAKIEGYQKVIDDAHQVIACSEKKIEATLALVWGDEPASK
jgi:hypothetical protein